MIAPITIAIRIMIKSGGIEGELGEGGVGGKTLVG
jgi:hypothetical protein